MCLVPFSSLLLVLLLQVTLKLHLKECTLKQWPERASLWHHFRLHIGDSPTWVKHDIWKAIVWWKVNSSYKMTSLWPLKHNTAMKAKVCDKWTMLQCTSMLCQGIRQTDNASMTCKCCTSLILMPQWNTHMHPPPHTLVDADANAHTHWWRISRLDCTLLLRTRHICAGADVAQVG